MVTNLFLKCEVCESTINLKWQVGHIDRAPVSIVCPKCKTILKFLLITNQENVSLDFEAKNISMLNKQVKADYIAETSSELLTYKINTQRMTIPGLTPFIRTSMMIGHEKYESFQEHVGKGISAYKNNLHIYERINDLYFNNNKEYLLKELNKQTSHNNLNNLSNEVEIIESLYFFNINYYSQFMKKDSFKEINERILNYMKVLRGESKEGYDEFLNNYCTDEKLLEYDKRINKSINTLITNFYYFIPSLIFDYVDESKHNEIYDMYTLTTTNFIDIKNIYLEVFENVLEVYDLIIMLNNIIENKDYSKYPTEIQINNKKIDTIQKFKKLSKGYKLKFLERNKYFDTIMPTFERKIRNAIGHELWEYIPFEHKVKIKDDEMYILEFVQKCWSLFDNTVAIYKVLQDIKRHKKLND